MGLLTGVISFRGYLDPSLACAGEALIAGDSLRGVRREVASATKFGFVTFVEELVMGAGSEVKGGKSQGLTSWPGAGAGGTLDTLSCKVNNIMMTAKHMQFPSATERVAVP